MLIDGLKKRLCRDLLVDTDSTPSGSVAITAFSYPNGDSVNLYFSADEDQVVVSDEGATADYLFNRGIEMTAERRDIVKTMCRPHDVEFVSPMLRRYCGLTDLGPSCLALCEAITCVASISYQVISPLRSSLPVAVDRLLTKKVQPKRGVERQWTHRRFDPKGSFPVDFHLNGIGEPRNIFSVTSPSKSIMTVAVINFLRSHRLNIPTLAIIDKNSELGPRDTNRLQLTAAELLFGIDGNEDRIVKFALAA